MAATMGLSETSRVFRVQGNLGSRAPFSCHLTFIHDYKKESICIRKCFNGHMALRCFYTLCARHVCVCTLNQPHTHTVLKPGASVGEQMLVTEDSWSCELTAFANMCFSGFHMVETHVAHTAITLTNDNMSHLRTVNKTSSFVLQILHLEHFSEPLNVWLNTWYLCFLW